MKDHKFILNGIIILVVLVAAFLAYRFFYVKSDEPVPEGLNAVDFSGDASQGTDEFIALINELQSVDLTTDLFASPAFQSLKNFSKPLIDEDKGRQNPFLPISVMNGLPAASSTDGSR